ncbi:MAG: glycine cleavage system protein H [bacterium]
MEIPNELKYNEDNSWVKVEGDTATVGITEPAAKKVQEFVFIQLPQKEKIKQGEKYVSIEAVKWSGHLTSPVSGEIIEVNDSLFDEPGKINQEPYKNWIMKVKLDDPKEVENLMDAKQAEEFYSK